jgi:hypothetical protein
LIGNDGVERHAGDATQQNDDEIDEWRRHCVVVVVDVRGRRHQRE